MSNETEDPSPFIKIIPAGEVVPGNDNLNSSLTAHTKKRIEILQTAHMEAKTIYLLAPWKMIGRRKRIQNISAKIELLGNRLVTSQEEDEHRTQKAANQHNVTTLPVDPSASRDAIENSSDALVLDLQEYEQHIAWLNDDTTPEDVLAVVDNS